MNDDRMLEAREKLKTILEDANKTAAQREEEIEILFVDYADVLPPIQRGKSKAVTRIPAF
jgi:dsDNA-binding SOS-regulon protein